MLSAVSSWGLGTTRGIIEPSAGVSATLIRLIPRLSARTIAMFVPERASHAVSPVRTRFGTTSAQRRSSRSTITPANGDSTICGSTNETSRALTALFERVEVKTRTVSA